MTSEIRTNSLTSRAGLSTVTLSDTGPIVTGIATFGVNTKIDGGNNVINVGTALTIGHTQGVQFNTQNLHSNGFEVNNINASGIITATSFKGDGSQLTGISGGISNIVEDTSPQLGGDLQSNGKDIDIADSDKINFGTGNDYQIFHDGGNSIQFFDAQVGDVRFRTDRGNTTRTNLNLGVGVDLYHSNTKRFETTSSGVKVSAGHLDLDDSQNIRLGNSQDFLIYHNGSNSIINDNGTGMHTNMSIWNGNSPVFAGKEYAGLSKNALYYIGGILKHAKALNAFTNPSTNSYKRLIPGFEAPVLLAYSAMNRSASIRIPYVESSKATRVEARFPDPTANPYLSFAALLMAGLDGIKNKIDPGEAATKDLYDLPPDELASIPTVCGSLREALNSLENDHEFLLQGDVFNVDQLEGYMDLKWEEVYAVEHTPHPVEYGMYYSL